MRKSSIKLSFWCQEPTTTMAEPEPAIVEETAAASNGQLSQEEFEAEQIR